MMRVMVFPPERQMARRAIETIRKDRIGGGDGAAKGYLRLQASFAAAPKQA
jgi:hypothetical protein